MICLYAFQLLNVTLYLDICYETIFKINKIYNNWSYIKFNHKLKFEI